MCFLLLIVCPYKLGKRFLETAVDMK